MIRHPLSLVIEGDSDLGAAGAVLQETGFEATHVFGRSGKSGLLPKLAGFNRAAEFASWLVLLDLDRDFGCAPQARADWLPVVADRMVFSVAVREIEAWLLADRERVAQFLQVSVDLVPIDPEALDDPKLTLVSLASRSRSRAIRDGVAVRPGSGIAVGPTYVSDVNEFAATRWRPRVAAQNSPSLARCLARLDELAQRIPSTG